MSKLKKLGSLTQKQRTTIFKYGLLSTEDADKLDQQTDIFNKEANIIRRGFLTYKDSNHVVPFQVEKNILTSRPLAKSKNMTFKIPSSKRLEDLENLKGRGLLSVTQAKDFAYEQTKNINRDGILFKDYKRTKKNYRKAQALVSKLHLRGYGAEIDESNPSKYGVYRTRAEAYTPLILGSVAQELKELDILKKENDIVNNHIEFVKKQLVRADIIDNRILKSMENIDNSLNSLLSIKKNLINKTTAIVEKLTDPEEIDEMKTALNIAMRNFKNVSSKRALAIKPLIKKIDNS